MLGVQYIRELNKFTLKDLSEKLSISSQAISMWENNKKPIPEKRLMQLSDIFEIPKEYFTKEVSDIDKLLIENIMLKKDFNASKNNYADYQYDKNSGEYKEITTVVVDTGIGIQIDINKAKTEAAQTLKEINDILSVKDNEVNYLELIYNVQSKAILFRRFADIIKTNYIPSMFLHSIMNAIELTIKFPEGLTEDIKSDLKSETKDIYKIINQYMANCNQAIKKYDLKHKKSQTIT